MRYDGTADFCPRCERETSTGLLRLSSGHIGRVCSACRVLRKGKPYASRFDFAHSNINPPPMPYGAEGIHEHSNK